MGREARSVDYTHRFWTDILLSWYYKFVRIHAGRFNRLQYKGAVIALYAGLFIPLPSQTIQEPVYRQFNVKPVQTLKVPKLAEIEPLETSLYPLAATGTYANNYAWGNCTEYVASRIPVPNSLGNAISWGYVLGGMGYTVSDVPKVGAIAWSTSDSYLGHVAIVESINDGVVIVSEANYNGLGVVDTRPANPGEFQYVYI